LAPARRITPEEGPRKPTPAVVSRDCDDLADAFELLLLPDALVVLHAVDVMRVREVPELRCQATGIDDRVLLGEQHPELADAHGGEDVEGLLTHRPTTDDEDLQVVEGQGTKPVALALVEPPRLEVRVTHLFELPLRAGHR
jgi:hypothetical protein